MSSSCCSSRGRCGKHQLESDSDEEEDPKRRKVELPAVKLQPSEERATPLAIVKLQAALCDEERKVEELVTNVSTIEAEMQDYKDKAAVLYMDSVRMHESIHKARQVRQRAQIALDEAEKRRLAQGAFWRCLGAILHGGEMHVPCSLHQARHYLCFLHSGLGACWCGTYLDHCPGLCFLVFVAEIMVSGCFARHSNGALLVKRVRDLFCVEPMHSEPGVTHSSSIHSTRGLQLIGVCSDCTERVDLAVDFRVVFKEHTVAALDSLFPDGRHVIADTVASFLFVVRPSCWDCQRPSVVHQ